MRTENAELKIRGMICRACTESVEETLLQTRGVLSARVRYVSGLAQVEYDPDLVTVETLEQRVAAAGYETGEKGVSGWIADLFCLILTALLVWVLTVSPLNPVPEAAADTGLGYLFVIGLLTSTHCIGMCGGILLGSTTNHDRTAKRSAPVVAAAVYNGGRLISYTLMGAVFGAVGTVITYTMSVRSMVFTLVGALVAVIGFNMWGLLPGLRALVPAPRRRAKEICRSAARDRSAHRAHALRLPLRHVARGDGLRQRGAGCAAYARVHSRDGPAAGRFRVARRVVPEKMEQISSKSKQYPRHRSGAQNAPDGTENAQHGRNVRLTSCGILV